MVKMVKMVKLKKMLCMILAGGLLCTVMLGASGCGDKGTGGSDDPIVGGGIKYQEIFDAIKDMDVSSSGSSKRILQTDYVIKDWLKDNTSIVSTSDVTDVGAELARYVAEMTDDEKAAFGEKCQAIVDAEEKVGSYPDSERMKAWGIEDKQYEDKDIGICFAFTNALAEGLESENIKPAVNFPFIEAEEPSATVFDRATFLDLIFSMSRIEFAAAGSTYSMDLDTADFMQFVIDNKGAKDTKEGVEACYAMLSPSNKLTFDWYFPTIIENVDTLAADPDIITAMGKSVTVDKFKKKDLNKLVKIISEVSGVSY